MGKGAFHKTDFLATEKFRDLEHALRITIKHPEYFEQALTHRSYLQVVTGKEFLSNERLEFLGDAVLGLVVADYLFSTHASTLEGDLTKMRSWLVNKNSLAIAAHKLHLDDFLLMSFSATKSLENGNDSMIADAMEAVIGAVYIDSGLDEAKKLIIDTLLPIMMYKSRMIDTNYKSILLEKVQSLGKSHPMYKVIDEQGPDHDKEFIVAVYVEGDLLATGKGKSKKQAEQLAAQNALQQSKFEDSNKEEPKNSHSELGSESIF
jgi:ribonuclease-3